MCVGSCKFNCMPFIDRPVNIKELLTLFYYFFFKFSFFLICACSFFVFSFLPNWKISLVAFVTIFRSRHWEWFCKRAVWQNITKINIYTFFYKIGVAFQHSLLNKKVYKYIKSEILRRYSSRVMIKKSIWQLYRTTTFLALLWMAASDNFLNKCNQKIRHMKNQVMTYHIIYWRKMLCN